MTLTYEMCKEKEEEFWERVNVGRVGECWEWKLSLSKGYGQFAVKSRSRRAHRVAWMLHNKKDVPGNLFVLHICHNKACCNPHHLKAGTAKENGRQTAVANRGGGVRGAKHHKTNLTAGDVEDMRFAYFSGGVKMKELARKYGITESTASAIIRGKWWKTAGGPIMGKDYHKRRYKWQDNGVV